MPAVSRTRQCKLLVAADEQKNGTMLLVCYFKRIEKCIKKEFAFKL